MIVPIPHAPELHSVLFICAANQCRSVMSEYALKALTAEKGFSSSQWRIESAGVHALNGLPATPFAAQALQTIGQDATNHRSRVLSCALAESFALILCMERSQKYLIQNACPALRERVLMFSELTEQVMDVDDPIGFSLRTYLETLALIQSYLVDGWQNLLSLSTLQ